MVSFTIRNSARELIPQCIFFSRWLQPFSTTGNFYFTFNECKDTFIPNTYVKPWSNPVQLKESLYNFDQLSLIDLLMTYKYLHVRTWATSLWPRSLKLVLWTKMALQGRRWASINANFWSAVKSLVSLACDTIWFGYDFKRNQFCQSLKLHLMSSKMTCIDRFHFCNFASSSSPPRQLLCW